MENAFISTELSLPLSLLSLHSYTISIVSAILIKESVFHVSKLFLLIPKEYANHLQVLVEDREMEYVWNAKMDIIWIHKDSVIFYQLIVRKRIPLGYVSNV